MSGRLHNSLPIFRSWFALVFLFAAPSVAGADSSSVPLPFPVPAPSETPAQIESLVPSEPNVFFGLSGLFYDFGGKASGNPTGATGLAGGFYPELTATYRYFWQDWIAIPTLGFSFLGHSDRDDGASRRVYHLGANLARKLPYFNELIEVRTGLGILFYRISGNGGVIELDNGTGKDKFFKPAYSETTRVFYLDLGGGVNLLTIGRGKLRADLDFLISGFLTARRSVNPVFGLSYGISL